ncbi:MAG: 50S ribosomal protein L29 [Deltaproteobacteria bacterium]|jgi:large subunit ribosomal protein L29|nr:50S ribosomal protein L29 [Candidatus Dadabacteria bacterium]TDI97861.1 MAG: 50S ribosomal protein L29 [Deltaproteobacteria bacterium]TDJ07122.1 MAG: 50S ribosomal protein L29 [Deltaproteobacteria bacterium]
MKTSEIRNLNDDQIVKKIEESRQELFNLRVQVSTQQLTKVTEISRVRKLIARLRTILKENQLRDRSKEIA